MNPSSSSTSEDQNKFDNLIQYTFRTIPQAVVVLHRLIDVAMRAAVCLHEWYTNYLQPYSVSVSFTNARDFFPTEASSWTFFLKCSQWLFLFHNQCWRLRTSGEPVYLSYRPLNASCHWIFGDHFADIYMCRHSPNYNHMIIYFYILHTYFSEKMIYCNLLIALLVCVFSSTMAIAGPDINECHSYRNDIPTWSKFKFKKCLFILLIS